MATVAAWDINPNTIAHTEITTQYLNVLKYAQKICTT